MRVSDGPLTYPAFQVRPGFGLRISRVQHLMRLTQSSLSKKSSIFVMLLKEEPFRSPPMIPQKYFLMANPYNPYPRLPHRATLHLGPSWFLLRSLTTAPTPTSSKLR